MDQAAKRDRLLKELSAAGSEAADLVAAVLQRHNPSGLRLHFAAPPEGDPRIGRLRDWMGIPLDPQQLFPAAALL